MIFEILIIIIICIALALYFFNKPDDIVDNPSNDIQETIKKKGNINKSKTHQVDYELAKNLGKVYHNITLQTFFDNTSSGGSRIRVRPLNSFQKNTRVEFPKSLRETNDIGSKFSASVKVCQKTFNKTGLPKGQPYLLADNKTITLLKK